MPSITVKDVDLFYELSGPEGAPVVAFSNSIGTTLEMWDAQAEALSAHYRCLRYDTRGHGRSAVADRPAVIGNLADDLAGLLDALSMPMAHIVGLSLGGMTGQAFALRYPDRTRCHSASDCAALGCRGCGSSGGGPRGPRSRGHLRTRRDPRGSCG